MMKRIQISTIVGFLSIFSALFLVPSCNKNKAPKSTDNAEVVVFRSNLPGEYVAPRQTRMDNGVWQTDDAIGVFMTKSGETAPYGKANARYATKSANAAEAAFTPFSTDDALHFPYIGNADFYAYYPYTAISEGTSILKLDISNQSEPKDIDLLYASAQNVAKQRSVMLSFRYVLPQLVFQFKDEKGTEIASSAISELTLHGVQQTADFDLFSNDLTPTGATADLLANSKTLSAIILPGMVKPLTVSFLYNGKKYQWNISDEGKNFQRAKRYTFSVMVIKDKVVYSETVNATITDREPGDHTEGSPLEPLDETPSNAPITLHEQGSTSPLANGSTISLSSGVAEKSFEVSTRGSAAWTATADAASQSWLTTQTSASALSLKAAANSQATQREATLTIRLASTTRMRSADELTLHIVQFGTSAQTIITTTPNTLNPFPATGGTQQLSVAIVPQGTDWQYTLSGEGFSASEDNNGTALSVTAQANTGVARSGKLILSSGSVQKELLLSQNAANNNITYGADLMITGYLHGQGCYLELYNPTDHPIDLKEYSLLVHPAVGKTTPNTINLSKSGIVLAPQEYLLLHQGGSLAATYPGKKYPVNKMYFDGNRAISLRNNGTEIEILGVPKNKQTEKDLYSNKLVRKKGIVNPNKTFSLKEWDKTSSLQDLNGFYMPNRQ